MNYTRDHMEAACCIWEAMLELKDKIPELKAAFGAHGTASMRDAAIDLAPACDAAWNVVPEGVRTEPFDWEFVPDFVRSLDWTQYPPALAVSSHHQTPEAT